MIDHDFIYNFNFHSTLLLSSLLTSISCTVTEGFLGGNEIANFTSDHLFSDSQWDVLVAVVNQQVGTNEGWDYCVATGVGLYTLPGGV